MSQRCSLWGFGGRYMELYDLVCEHALQRSGLRPDIDLTTAWRCCSWGAKDARWSVGLDLCACGAAMVAHAVERRDTPPFGVHSSTARKLLAAVPAGRL
jgi:NADH:ubiquinone oxidoreductase subunit B-like Fe-S oxidoreductase